MEIRTERPGDVDAIRAVTAAAFARVPHAAPPVEPDGAPGEATLVGWLREDPGWLPDLSLVAEVDGEVVGHAVGTRGDVSGAPAVGLGPVSVHPDHQGAGVGSALVRSMLRAAGEQGESTVVLLGEPAFYGRFGFVEGSSAGVEPPVAAWGPYFQVVRLTPDGPRGTFTYAAPFSRLGG